MMMYVLALLSLLPFAASSNSSAQSWLETVSYTQRSKKYCSPKGDTSEEAFPRGLFSSKEYAKAKAWCDSEPGCYALHCSYCLATHLGPLNCIGGWHACGQGYEERDHDYYYCIREKPQLPPSMNYLPLPPPPLLPAPSMPPSSPPSGALVELTGDMPKIAFGDPDSPTCELSLNRVNSRLESTCEITTAASTSPEGRRLQTFAEHDCKKELAVLKAEMNDMRRLMAELATNRTALSAE